MQSRFIQTEVAAGTQLRYMHSTTRSISFDYTWYGACVCVCVCDARAVPVYIHGRLVHKVVYLGNTTLLMVSVYMH